jgi:hypothetical protein
MSQEDDAAPDDVAGLPVEDAVDAVVARDDGNDRDRGEVRAALETVAEDGVVAWDGVDEALAHVSKVVATPETRVELAARGLSDAREAASPVADLDAVDSRLTAFEARLAAVESRTADLGADLQTLVARPGEADPDADLYATARGIRRLTANANEAQRAADELGVDVEEFEEWLADPDVRYEEFEGDVDAVERSVDELTAAVDRLEADLAEGADGDGTGDGEGAGDEEGNTPADAAATWFDLTLRSRVIGLLLADVRAELADLRTWADRENLDHGERLDAFDARLADLDDRVAAAGDRLADLARPDWRARFDDRLDAFGSALDGVEPPVDWGEVQATLEEHRGVQSP